LGITPMSFADIFAGTGVVGASFNGAGVPIFANDYLEANAVCLRAWLSPEPYDAERIETLLRKLGRLKAEGPGAAYFAACYGGKYFHSDTAGQIGAVRDAIQQADVSPRERDILLASLIYCIDKLANTCGHYDAYRQIPPAREGLHLKTPVVFSPEQNAGNVVTCLDVNDWVNRYQTDVLYLDPPYNSRQYSCSYHVIENLARWQFPAVRGVTAKFENIKSLRSQFGLRGAARALRALVLRADCRHIFFSYNNMARKGDERSNAALSDADIQSILSLRGPVQSFATKFKHFSTGKRDIDGHQERVFYCQVTNPPQQ